LEAWISRQIKEGANDLTGSVISYENAPIIQWKLSTSILNYNIIYTSFFFSDNLYFFASDAYFQLNSSKAGALENFLSDNGAPIRAKIVSPNSNFREPAQNMRLRSVSMLHGDVELENSAQAQSMLHKFFRVSRMPWTCVREVRFKPEQGNRNIAYRVAGIGMGTDFQMEIHWDGNIRINNLFLEME
jgi:hypothetical protein